MTEPTTAWLPGDRVIVHNNVGPDVTGTVIDPETHPMFVNLKAEDPTEHRRMLATYVLFVDADVGLAPAPGARTRWVSPTAHEHDHHPHRHMLNIRPDQLDRVRAEAPPSPFHRN
jgi:hypothetical protein